jgi:hypothetical protein
VKRHRVFYGNYYDMMRLDVLNVPRPKPPKLKKSEKRKKKTILREIRDLLRSLAKQK